MLDDERLSVTVHCPDCRAQYEITTAPSSGLRVRCPRCGAVFPVPAPGNAGTESRPDSAAPAPPPPSEEVEPRSWSSREQARRSVRPREKIKDPRLARRLARNMLSEILLNRPGDREKALRDDTVLSRFGPAIMAAYRVYGSKVSPQLEESRDIFREAVNEILGNGARIL